MNEPNIVFGLMDAPDITVVIKTLCRASLGCAITSALREQFFVVVVSDGCPFPEGITGLRHPAVKAYRLGRPYGQYGAMAFNVGALMATTPFVAMLDDDDEFIPGAHTAIKRKMAAHPSVDVWIPGLQYSDGRTACCNKGLQPGNVACPILRAEVMTKAPLVHVNEDVNCQDFYHIKKCHAAGYKIDWIAEPCILVRPKLPGDSGRGKK